MKRSILFLFLVSLIGTPVYNHASSWNEDAIAKMGVVVAGVAAMYYFFTSADTQEDLNCNNNDLGCFSHQNIDVNQEKTMQPGCIEEIIKPVQPKQSKPSNSPEESRKVERKDQQSVASKNRSTPKKVTSVVDKITGDYDLQKKKETGVLANITWMHFKYAGAFLVACCLISALYSNLKDTKIGHITLCRKIANNYHNGSGFYKKTCVIVAKHQDQESLTSEAASAITTYITGLHKKLNKCHTAAQSIARSFDGYKNNVSPVDVNKLILLDRKSYWCLNQLVNVEQCSRGELGAQRFGRVLLESKEEKEKAALIKDKEDPKSFEEAAGAARAQIEQIAEIEQERLDQQLSKIKSLLDALFIAISVPIAVQSFWFLFWEEKKKRDRQRLGLMLLRH